MHAQLCGKGTEYFFLIVDIHTADVNDAAVFAGVVDEVGNGEKVVVDGQRRCKDARQFPLPIVERLEASGAVGRLRGVVGVVVKVGGHKCLGPRRRVRHGRPSLVGGALGRMGGQWGIPWVLGPSHAPIYPGI